MTDYVIKYYRLFRILHNDVPRFSTMNVKKRKKEFFLREWMTSEKIYTTQCVCVCVCVCARMCVRERERERQKS